MQQLDDSISHLKDCIIKSKSKQRATAQEIVGLVASYLVFLKSSSISSDTSVKLGRCLRKQLVPVYKAFPQPTLEFSAALYNAIFDGKITAEDRTGRKDQKDLWESVLNALLSGILDFLDANGNDKSKDLVGAVFYPILCATLLSGSALNLGYGIRCAGYSVLSDSADSHKANQKRLRDDALLGGARLGAVLWRTRDYLCMEGLLDVLARMIPPSCSTPSGRTARRSFIRSVFVDSSPAHSEISKTLADIVEHLKTPDWAETSAQITDIMASSDINYSQPFQIHGISVHGQQKRSNRVFIDKTGFLANVLVEEDMFDSLSAAYTGVLNVEVSLRPSSSSITKPPLCSIVITLDSPPLIGQEPVSQPTTEGDDARSTVSFAVSKADLPRLQAALKSRGVGYTVKTNDTAKQSVLASPAALEIDMAGNLINRHEFDQRIENLSQLYGTNEPSDDPPVEAISATRNEILCIDPKLTLALLADPFPADLQESAAEGPTIPNSCSDALSGTISRPEAVSAIILSDPASASSSVLPMAPDPPKTPVKRTHSQVMRDAVFGASDEELSEIECLPTPPRPRKSKSLSGNKPAERSARPSVKISGRRVFDSEDEVLGSTPTHAPTTKRAVKRAVVVSDDEIEDVLTERAPIVSRQRSMLLMTPVTSSISRRRTIPTKPSVNLGAAPDRPKTPALSVEPGALKTATVDSTAENLLVDLPAMEFASPNAKEVTPAGPTAKKSAQDAMKASPEQVQPTFDDMGDCNISEPLVVSAPRRKSVKAALRKKNQQIGEAAPIIHASTPKRKRIPEDEIRKDSDGVPRKRARAAEGDTNVVKSRTNGSAGVPKQYRGRKAKGFTSPMSAQKNVDYDLIPGTSPATSQQQSVKKPPASDSKKAKKEKEPSKAKAVAAKPPPKDKVRDTKPKPKPKPKRTSKATENAETSAIAIDRPVTKHAPAKVASPSPRPDSPGPAIDFAEQDLTMVDLGPEDCGIPPAAEEKSVEPTNVAIVPSKLPSIASAESNKAPWGDLHPTERPEHAEDLAICATEDIVDLTLDDPIVNTEEQEGPGAEPIFSPKITSPTPGAANARAVLPEKVPKAAQTPARESSSTGINCIDLTGSSPIKNFQAIHTPHKTTATPTKSSLLRSVLDKPALHVTPQTPRAKGNVTFASETFTRKDSSPKRDRTPRLSTNFKPAHTSTRLVSLTSGTLEASRNPPSFADIASVLGEIQEAILYKITHNVNGVREDIRRGRERLLAEAISDLVKMRGESIDCYNNLIELEAEYATFGRKLGHSIEDLVAANHSSQEEVQKAIQMHDRGSIVKRMPTTLLPTNLPASIKRLSK